MTVDALFVGQKRYLRHPPHGFTIFAFGTGGDIAVPAAHIP
jgi:hypothetical protein